MAPVERIAGALSGTPAAVSSGAPLLLVDGPGATFDGAPDATLQEVRRLHPDHILVLGGPLAVDDPTVAQLVVAATDPTIPTAEPDHDGHPDPRAD